MAQAPDRLIDRLIADLAARGPRSVYLVTGDLVLAEPAARRLAVAAAERAGCEVETHRRPPRLEPLLDDLRTFSLFTSAKVLLAMDTAVLADRAAAADLIDDAAEALPLPRGEAAELSPARRLAASRLLQALRLFGLDPAAGDGEALLGELPAWALEGGSGLRRNRPRGRAKKQVEELRRGLVDLLEAARGAEMEGRGEGAQAALSAVIREGAPEGHTLILAERSAASDHPLVVELERLGAVAEVGRVESGRDGWQGLDLLARQLREETGIDITRDAMAELARRTLHKASDKRGEAGSDADSTARLAGEYRKLAAQAGSGGKIDRRLVEGSVTDRGEEDVWKILDAVAQGRGGEAVERLQRHLGAADNTLSARLAFMGLLAAFCRHLTAIAGMMRLARVRSGERNYGRFKAQLAPALQGELAAGVKNPLAGLHPFRLHKAYLAACRLPLEDLAILPWRVLETELLVKGESHDADAALIQLLARLAAP